MEKVLVIGASTNETRYSFLASKMLQEYGHEVTCYGRKKGLCAGIPIQNEFPQNQKFDTVTMYMNAQNQMAYHDKILALKPGRVIFNPGAENEALQTQLDAAGIPWEEACTLVLLRTKQF